MSDGDTDRDSRGTWVALTIMIVAGLVWSVATFVSFVKEVAPFLHQGDYASVGGALAGHAMVIALVVTFVVYIVMAGKWPPHQGLRYFAILFGIVVLANAGLLMAIKSAADSTDRQDAVQGNIALADMRAAFSSMTADTQPGAIDMQIRATGQAGIMEGLVKHFVVTVLTDRQNYKTDLHGTGYPGFLSAPSLGARKGVATAQHKLAAVHRLVAEYSSLNRRRIADFRNAISGSALDASNKTDMLNAYEQSVGEKEARRTRIWALEDGVVTENEHLLNDLAHPNGYWIASGKVLRFSNGADIATFNAHIRNIDTMVAEERALQTQAQEDRQRDLAPPPQP
jgi:hypothetical protein